MAQEWRRNGAVLEIGAGRRHTACFPGCQRTAMSALAISLFLVCLLALGLDRLLGEPRRGHPLVGFGAAANWLEQRLNRNGGGARWQGALGVLLLVMLPVGLAWAASRWLPWPALLLLEVVVLYLAIGWRSLVEHARAVALPLEAGDLAGARTQVGRIVSRDTAGLDGRGVATAATESVLENGADAVFASLFWFVVAGLPGVVLHRLVNTLDAMWGYRTPRHRRFGWTAARLDDLLNWLPARLTALSYALAGFAMKASGHPGWTPPEPAGGVRQALVCWWRQGHHWESPNAGPVMAAGAGALGLRLGGEAPYHGAIKSRPGLGPDNGRPADARAIHDALGLVRRSVLLWLLGLALLAVVLVFQTGGVMPGGGL